MIATTHTRKYAWGKLAVRADFTQATDVIRYATDEDIPANEYDATVFQVADARHSPKRAFGLVNDWLKRQAG